MLTFQSLNIEVSKWSEDKTPKGKIEFTDNTTVVQIQLTPADCKAMLAICADRMQSTINAAASEMVGTLLDGIVTKQIENKE